jgi:monothiol glutaredoxin
MTDASRSPFEILNPTPPVSVPVSDDPDAPPRQRVERMVKGSEMFVFMKGSPDAPRCGFSANTVALLDAYGFEYDSFDVLSDDAIRAAAKEYGNWPTFPQVWLRGELLGGNDILVEMHHSGELENMVREASR